MGFPIEKVEISREKSMIYHPEYRGIILGERNRDVLLKYLKLAAHAGSVAEFIRADAARSDSGIPVLQIYTRSGI